MKLECVKLNLKDALLTAERFTAKQATLPVLRFVLLIANNTSLRLRATNLDLGFEIELPAKVEKEGVIAIPADTLGAFLSNLPNERNIILEQIGDHLTITGDKYSTLIKGYGYEDFPTLPFIEKGPKITLPVKTLINAFKSTQYAAAVSDIKPEFASVLATIENNILYFVATDSSRLAEKKVLLKVIPEEEIRILIPSKNVTEISRALDGIDDDVNIYFSRTQLTITSKNLKLTTRLVDGIFPDYNQIIPKTFTTEAILLRQDIIDRLKITTIFSGKLQQVRVKIYPQDGIFEIEARNDEVGETSQQIESALTGESVEYLLNTRYLNDVLSVISSDSVIFKCAGPGRPIVIEGVSDASFRYLLMPMRG
jgi:DNA polymerase-3 subunit beta